MYKNILIVAIATLLFSSKLCAQDMGAGFVLPAIPETLTTPEQRADYLAQHYWDSLDMADMKAVESDVTRAAFADFVSILPYCTSQRDAFATLWRRCYPYRDAYYYMLELAEFYLYDVASPQRNEELYIEALEVVVEDAEIEDIDKIAVRSQLKLLKRNRVGEVATDFEFVDKEGAKHRLSEYRAEYLLLLFASADCEDCKRMKRVIDANTRLWMMLRRGSLAIVAITITDDTTAWQATSVPERWIEGWDSEQAIEHASLYDLTTKPRLYLLDREHRILLKNTTPQQVEEYLLMM